jgi:hypothetical protein
MTSYINNISLFVMILQLLDVEFHSKQSCFKAKDSFEYSHDSTLTRSQDIE